MAFGEVPRPHDPGVRTRPARWPPRTRPSRRSRSPPGSRPRRTRPPRSVPSRRCWVSSTGSRSGTPRCRSRRPLTRTARAARKIAARGTAKSRPPPSSAVSIDAAIGTLAAVAARKSSRTERELPDTTLADHVNCDQGSHINRNSSVACPMPFHVASCRMSATSCENANTYARSKNSSTGSAEKSSSRSGSTSPRTSPENTWSAERRAVDRTTAWTMLSRARRRR